MSAWACPGWLHRQPHEGYADIAMTAEGEAGLRSGLAHHTRAEWRMEGRGGDSREGAWAQMSQGSVGDPWQT